MATRPNKTISIGLDSSKLIYFMFSSFLRNLTRTGPVYRNPLCILRMAKFVPARLCTEKKHFSALSVPFLAVCFCVLFLFSYTISISHAFLLCNIFNIYFYFLCFFTKFIVLICIFVIFFIILHAFARKGLNYNI